jgi:hypothetical protein
MNKALRAVVAAIDTASVSMLSKMNESAQLLRAGKQRARYQPPLSSTIDTIRRCLSGFSFALRHGGHGVSRLGMLPPNWRKAPVPLHRML